MPTLSTFLLLIITGLATSVPQVILEFITKFERSIPLKGDTISNLVRHDTEDTSGICCITRKTNDTTHLIVLLLDISLSGISKSKKFQTLFHLVPDSKPLQLAQSNTLSRIFTASYAKFNLASGELYIPTPDRTEPMIEEAITQVVLDKLFEAEHRFCNSGEKINATII